MIDLAARVSRGAALGAAFGLVGCGPLRALRHLADSCIDVPGPAKKPGPIIEGVVPRRGRQEPVKYALALPRDVAPRTIDRIVYLLPGRGGTAIDSLLSLGFAGYAADVMATGVPPFAVLAIDSGESYFHPRTSGEDRLAIVERDLPSIARRTIAPRLKSEALIGMSMGGYGALLAAERNPMRYCAVGVAGPALFRSFAEEDRAVGGAFDSSEQFATYDVIAHAARLAHVPVMVRIGHDDPFLANAKLFAQRCVDAHVDFIEHGCHDDGFWRASAFDLLAFTMRSRNA